MAGLRNGARLRRAGREGRLSRDAGRERLQAGILPAGDDAITAAENALPESTENDIYRIIFTGEAEPVALPEVYRALEGRFFSLSLRDGTTPKQDLWAAAGEDTLRGLFLRELRQRYDAADTPEEKQCIADAARLGLAAMDGREAPEL